MWCPNDDWYETIFDDCKSKAEVVEKATETIKNRDKQIQDLEEKAITIAQGNVATIETLINQMY